eukprot:364811-Chlamydomonas_euryale.AAC.1
MPDEFSKRFLDDSSRLEARLGAWLQGQWRLGRLGGGQAARGFARASASPPKQDRALLDRSGGGGPLRRRRGPKAYVFVKIMIMTWSNVRTTPTSKHEQIDRTVLRA